MGIFKGHVNIYNMTYVPCGEKCEKCGSTDPGCTMQDEHNKTIGHRSSQDKDGCGHSWGQS